MKTLLKGAIVALALAGASVAVAPAPAQAAASFGFFIGPDNGARIYYNQGVYRDRFGHRHYYRYPRDYRRYHNNRDWYRTHPRWWRDNDWRR